MSKKERIVQILRIIMPMVGLICIVIFSPWDGIWAWITPVPDSVQVQVDDAIGYGLDGIVVYVNTNGGTPLVPVFDTQGGTKVMVSNIVYNRIVQILRGCILLWGRSLESELWGRSLESEQIHPEIEMLPF